MPSYLTSSNHCAVLTKKRRKIRKGTTSCWECKRRKVRCSLVDSPGGVCKACQRRGTKCLTQDYPVEDEVENAPGGLRMARVPEPSSPAAADSPGLGPGSPFQRIIADSERDRRSISTSLADPYASISQELYASLPSRNDLSIICNVLDQIPILFYAFITCPYPIVEKDSHGFVESRLFLNIPDPVPHPALLARYMLRIVMALQSLDLKKCGAKLTGLSEAPQVMTKRLAETAIRLVTSRDELLGTVEGIECVMMEGSYKANNGYYCPAWIAFRKAMTLAQAIGIHRPGHSLRLLDRHCKVDGSFLWYRATYIDRFMCLMMGRPQGSMDCSMATGGPFEADTPLGQLERVHCVIAHRILERNDAGIYSVEKIHDIDSQLQKAAEMMPSEWWTVPNIAQLDGSIGWEMRLVSQINHYGLINQLHIPYMLRFANAEQLQSYSQTTCINASREILTRYIVLGNSNRVAYTCRVIDFFTLSSALLLLLAHLRQHSRSPGEFNPLAHQRQSDRGMISQTLDNLQKIAWVSQDRIIAKSADLLSRLLDIEGEAAQGSVTYVVHSIGSSEEVKVETERGPPPLTRGLRFCIPWFGFVRIERGFIPCTSSAAEIVAGKDILQFRPPTPVDQDPLVTDATNHPPAGEPPATGPRYGQESAPSQQPQPWYADAGIGVDDWTMQGFDMSFWNCFFQGPSLAMPSYGTGIGMEM
ncbi:uncharacterized protein BDW70DRAFT_88750 [Aspergillus foveolatus]|uniref:uncharacterized protein n=1 Tax=Aspergillus foveolatus TaxID=210207 RepID=UPI003CCE3CB1